MTGPWTSCPEPRAQSVSVATRRRPRNLRAGKNGNPKVRSQAQSVAVAANAAVVASEVADVIVGVATLLTVMPLPVASEISVLPITVFQSSVAARL